MAVQRVQGRAAIAVGPSEREAKRRLAGHWWTPYLFMAPYLVLFTIFVLIPVFYGLWISLHEWDYLLPGKPFVGLDNYTDLLTAGSQNGDFFWDSMRATGIFTAFSVPLLVLLALLLAVVLNQKFQGQRVFRAIYFAPYALGVGVIGILWRFLLDPNVGAVNFFLGQVGLPDNSPWTTATPWVWAALVGPTVWWTLGLNTVIFLAGLQDIPRDHYDAAKVDGANNWQIFRHVTVPGLRPVLIFVITITILASGVVFGQPYLITQGAPSEESRSAVMYFAEVGLRQFNMGNASAMSYILAFFLIMVAIINFRYFGRRED